MSDSFPELDIVVVHYLHARPTVAMLTALFRHYPAVRVTVVDNSGGKCRAEEHVLPHLSDHASRIRLLTNPSVEHDRYGALSHGGGIDLARRLCDRPYLLSMETDTFVLGSGAIEFVLDYMERGFDWAGVGQKPVGEVFASFSPCFAIFRTELLAKYDLSFRRRARDSAEAEPSDLLMQHHREAASRVRSGLPTLYPEGKPPDTYRRSPAEIEAAELAHLEYFDTGEWAHHVLTKAGHRGELFRSPPSICHTWGSRNEAIFLRNFLAALPEGDLQGLLPPVLRVDVSLLALPHDSLLLVDLDLREPQRHWVTPTDGGIALSADGDTLVIRSAIAEGQHRYIALGLGGFDSPPSGDLSTHLAPNALHEVRCVASVSGGLAAQLRVIEYGDSGRIQDHRQQIREGPNELDFVTSMAAQRFRVLFRVGGRGTLRVQELLLFGLAPET